LKCATNFTVNTQAFFTVGSHHVCIQDGYYEDKLNNNIYLTAIGL